MISLVVFRSSSNRIPKALLLLPQFDGKHVEVEPTEQVALAQIHGLRQQGRSLRETAGCS